MRLAKRCGLASSLLTIPSGERDAPTILRYDATYGGRIRSKVVDKASEADPRVLPEELLPSKDKPLRGTLRLPTEAEPFEGEETMPPRSMKAILQKKLKEKERELAEQKKSGMLGASGSVPSQKALPPSLFQKRPPSATIPAQDAPASKRVKSHASKAGAGGSLSRVEAKEKESEGEKKKGKGASLDLDVP